MYAADNFVTAIFKCWCFAAFLGLLAGVTGACVIPPSNGYRLHLVKPSDGVIHLVIPA